MDGSIQIISHVDADGTLRLEGLHQIAGQDVLVRLSPTVDEPEAATQVGDLTPYRVRETGPVVADRILAIARRCATLPVFDDRSPDEILGYNELGLPS
ncbi:MAG: hypothetical protein AAFW75_15135 [Cyanobacteria bacterium J06636_16]